jgi:hypothetical protein
MDEDEERQDEEQDRPEDEEQAPVVDRGDPSAVVQMLPYVSHPISPELADHLVQTLEWREGDPLPSDEDLIKAARDIGLARYDSDQPDLNTALDKRLAGEPGDDGPIGGLLAGLVPPPDGYEVASLENHGEVPVEDRDETGEEDDGEGDEDSSSGLIKVSSKARRGKKRSNVPHSGAATGHDDVGYTGLVNDPYPKQWDARVEREVAIYNDEHGFKPGDEEYLDPKLIQAQMRAESGGSPKAYANDPMQVNNRGDWDDKKAQLGLKKGVVPGPDLSIRAGIRWLARKAYEYDSRGEPVKFNGWNSALEGYKGRGNQDYVDRVLEKKEGLGP